MKTIKLLLPAIMLQSMPSMAQKKTTEFYVNPNINIGHDYRNFNSRYTNLQSTLTLGYLWGNKNKHNFSVSALAGGFGKPYKTYGFQMRYSFDYLAFTKNRFSLFLSPYIKSTVNFAHYNSRNAMHWKNRTLSASIGIAPQVEYRLSKRVDLVFSAPIGLFGISNSAGQIHDGTKEIRYHSSNTSFFPSMEANAGIRIRLFGKK
jgi:hypothetical protein